MSHINTYTGKQIDPLHPDIESVKIEDIAHALSLTCRGNGHVKTFFSVAQHCVYCAKEAEARGYAPEIILACLLHDASEAYMSDVPRPFKDFLPEYREREEDLLNRIYHKFIGRALTEDEKRWMKAIDDDLLYFDMKELLNVTMDGAEPLIHISLDYRVQPFETVEKEYLELFHKWSLHL